MQIEKQVTSLKLSKKLKELSVKQESYFYWIRRGRPFKNYELGTDISKETEFCSAFTVAELGEMFGNLMILGGFGPQSKHYSYKYFGFGNRVEKDFVADTEADARALMLINIIKNSLLDKHEK